MKRILTIILFVIIGIVSVSAQTDGSKRKPRQTTTQSKAASQKQTATSKPKQSTNQSRSQAAILQELANNMVYVQGGTFTMGATAEQGSDALGDEKPTHQVTVSDFYICKYEVTQELWQAVMGSNPSEFKGTKKPVECVSWVDCMKFISKLNSITGKYYRLPTETEWEFAARGGNKSRGYKYSGSNNINNIAWFGDNSGGPTHDVGMKASNELGIYDMSGNVWEWCSDWYGYYSSNVQTNPTEASSGSFRVRRGGSWFNNARGCRVSNRNADTPGHEDNILGLRLALSK